VRLLPLLCLSLTLPACAPPSTTTAAKTAPDDNISFPLDVFTLTERSGKKVGLADLKGKVWVASFVFTRCTGPCPQVSAAVARLQAELPDREDLKLVTFTVDPKRDNPAELRKYAEAFRADPQRWLFLTGGEEEIHRLLKESFKVPVERNQDAKPGDEFGHSTRLVVVDRHGNVRGYYNGVADPSAPGSKEELERDLKRLKAKVTALLAEKP
jgi:protein SCO1/2